MEKILITGGAGFAGSSLALLLRDKYPKIKIIALDNLKRRGSELNLPRLKKKNIEFFHGDIRNPEDLEAVGGFDLMLECSAEPSVLAGCNESPKYLINTNLLGTVNCLEAVRNNKAIIIFLSTSRVYPVKAINQLLFTEEATRFELAHKQETAGISSKGINEKFSLEGTRSLYGTTKLASEMLIQEYIETYGIKGVINRCGVLTGPWQMGKLDQGVVVLWLARHIFNKKLSYIGFGGTGKQVRDILHIKDLFKLIDLQMNSVNDFNGEIYNVGGGPEISVSLLELTKQCEEITGKKIDIASVKEIRPNDIPYYITDSSKINKKSGWKPEITCYEIFKEIADWININKEILEPILS